MSRSTSPACTARRWGGLVAAEGQDLAHQVAGALAGFFDLAQAFLQRAVLGAVGHGQFHIAQDGADDVVEVVRNAAGQGAQGLHLVRFAQLHFQFAALGFGALAAGEVAGKDGGGLAFAIALERDADFHRDVAAAGGAAGHLAQHRLGGQRGQLQRIGRIGQKALQAAAQGFLHRAQEQRGGRGVEDRDAPLAVHADDGVHGGVDHRLQAPLAGVQLGVALLQGLALGQQRTLVDHGAHELGRCRAGALGDFDAGDVQVALHGMALGHRELHFVHFAAALLAGFQEGLGHAVGVFGHHKGHEGGQQPVLAGRLEGAVRHGVGLDDDVVLVDHQQRQRHAGEQRLEAFGRAFCHRLAVVQHLVLDFQLGLVVAQLGDQCGQRVVGAVLGGFPGVQIGIDRRQRRRRGQQILRGVRIFVLQQKGEVRAAHRSGAAARVCHATGRGSVSRPQGRLQGLSLGGVEFPLKSHSEKASSGTQLQNRLRSP
ncbi:hypothetical protein CT3_23630 [Comamonas terrigena NBRC 13299]|nr:hypothetical protein CT3_23630 [Comamonas terrigena NBRC 13299]